MADNLFDDSQKSNSSRSNVAELSVSEISGSIKRTVEGAFSHVRIRGEISGFRGQHSSGHAYFSLKDDRARMDAVIWKGVFNRLKFKPEEGMEMIATGKITTFAGSSKYQIVIEQLEPAGAGALMALLEERKRKLAAEGLFGDDRKQLLPFMPKTIGVVTSPTGAVIRDILHRISDRFPIHVIVWPVRVQGETSGDEVARAIRGFNTLDGLNGVRKPDLIIVARGGGSLEDLWGFNDEAVVRAASDSDIPLISAVGHETDWTLIDLVADARAPTPTGAAEMAVPVKADLDASLSSLNARLSKSVSRNVDQRRQNLNALSRGLPSLDSLLALPRRRLDEAASRLGKALAMNTLRKRQIFDASALRLTPISLRSSLRERGAKLDQIHQRIDARFSQITERRKAGFERHALRLKPIPARLDDQIKRLDAELLQFQKRADLGLSQRISNAKQGLSAQNRVLQSLAYGNVLKRGYTIIRNQDNIPIMGANSVEQKQAMIIEFADGRVDVVENGAGEIKPRDLTTTVKPKKSVERSKKADKPTSQGSLF